MVPEWKAFYIDYQYLKILLKPFKIMSNLYVNIPYSENQKKKCITNCEVENNDLQGLKITNFPKENFSILKDFSSRFEEKLLSEKEKIDSFFSLKFEEVFKRFRIFKINALLMKNYKEKDLENKTAELKNCFHIFYQEIIFLIDFFPLNFEGFRKIIKKYNKLSSKISDTKFKLELGLYEIFKETFIQNNYLKLQKLKQDLENLYLENFYCQDHREEGRSELSKISQGKLISQWEGYFFGFFSGCAFILFLIILAMAWQGDLDPDQNSGYFQEMFQMYRGLALFIAYIWLLAWNVYIWTTYRINYKLIFKFNAHYSKVNEIMKRGAFFTSIFFVCFIWYIINKEETQKLSPLFFWFPKEYCPLIGWILLIIYIIFPSKKYFNGEGRIYMFKILRDIFFYSFFAVNFVMNWSTDQLVSFVIPIRDLEYTICYYSSKASGKDISNCRSADLLVIPFLAATIPLGLRMIQCTRANFQSNNKFVLICPDFFNFLKYLTSFSAVLMSFFYNMYQDTELLFIFWVLSAFLSSVYSYYWDLKMDWGFLDSKAKNKYLRKQLAYPNIRWYYMAIYSNLLLRFAWILSISAGIIQTKLSMRKEVIILIVGFLEMFRRAIWNFFRVEKEHINNCGVFKAVENYKLPFENIKSKINDKKLLQKDLDDSYDYTNYNSVRPNFDGKSVNDNNLTDSLLKNEEISINFNLHVQQSGIFSERNSSNISDITVNKENIIESVNLEQKEKDIEELREEIGKFEVEIKEKFQNSFKITLSIQSSEGEGKFDQNKNLIDYSFQENS